MSLVETLELLVKERHYVAEGEEYLVDQRKIVDRLERRGKDPLDAILFLGPGFLPRLKNPHYYHVSDELTAWSSSTLLLPDCINYRMTLNDR